MKFFRGLFIAMPISLLMWVIIIKVCLGQTISIGGGSSSLTVGGGNASVSLTACNGASSEVGNRTLEEVPTSMTANATYAFRSQADCTGTITNAYLYYDETSDIDAKVCIYTSDNADLTADGARVLVGCSAGIASGASTGWKTNTISGSVTAGSYYWVVIIKAAGGTPWWVRAGEASTRYARATAGYYASPPDPLPSTGWTSGTLGPVSAYVDIQ